jgi:hypothetical protein
MAEVAAHARNGGAAAQAVLQRQPSFSSFPPSRSPSAISVRNESKKARSPQPPMVREDDDSIDSSHNSSVSARRSKGSRLRSQYPAHSTENHVEYILVASFDIDRGSIMEHQYPGAISGDETMLAELMLPDQAHVRSQDWTIFFLHKDTSAEEEEKEARRERRRKRKRRKNGEDEEDTAAGAEESADDNDDDDDDDDEDDDSDDYSESDEELDPDGPPLVYVLNLVNTKQDNTVKRYAPRRRNTPWC